MRMRYFGDSYDIVKKSLLFWLRRFGNWSVHPMFTEPVSAIDVAAFEVFLDATIISTEVLTPGTSRPKYLSCGLTCGHLLLDPDTGLQMQPKLGRRAQEYLFSSELIWLVEGRPSALTIVFDKSIGRGRNGYIWSRSCDSFRKMEFLDAPTFLTHLSF